MSQPLNLLRAVFAPGGLRGLCVDEDWLCGGMWVRACREAQHLARLRALLEELRPTLQPWASLKVGQLFPTDDATRAALDAPG